MADESAMDSAERCRGFESPGAGLNAAGRPPVDASRVANRSGISSPDPLEKPLGR